MVVRVDVNVNRIRFREVLYGLGAGCELWRGVGISGLMVFFACACFVDLQMVYLSNCWLFSCRLCCHYQRKTETSCFNQWWNRYTKSSALQACNTEVAGKTTIQSVNEISWVGNKSFYKNGNRTTRNPQKHVSPFPISFDSLTCWSRFLSDLKHNTDFFLNELT